MSSAGAIHELPLVRSSWISRAKWIQSPRFDIAFFILAPLLTLPIMAAAYLRMPLIAIGGGLTLAFAHYFSSAAFLVWDENQPYYRSRRMAFIGGPLLIAAVYFTLIRFHVPYAIQFVLFFWNTFHVARQNCGILSIYRHRAGVFDPVQRNAANYAIIAVSTWLALWNIGTHKEVAALFTLADPRLGRFLFLLAGAVAAVFFVRLVYAMVTRMRAGNMPSLSELLFLCTGIFFFYPYIFIKSSELATFAMLLPHYVQYMGLVWLLHRRKFTRVEGSLPQRTLAHLSGKTILLIPVLVAIGAAFYGMHEVSVRTGRLEYFEIAYLIIALEHFYLDGLIWAFREPHVRATIAPHLLRGA